jgi:hypothetical protein
VGRTYGRKLFVANPFSGHAAVRLYDNRQTPVRAWACPAMLDGKQGHHMNFRDPRVMKTIWVAGLAVTALNAGVALQKLDAGYGTTMTGVSLALNAVALSAFLLIILRDIWKAYA